MPSPSPFCPSAACSYPRPTPHCRHRRRTTHRPPPTTTTETPAAPRAAALRASFRALLRPSGASQAAPGPACCRCSRRHWAASQPSACAERLARQRRPCCLGTTQPTTAAWRWVAFVPASLTPPPHPTPTPTKLQKLRCASEPSLSSLPPSVNLVVKQQQGTTCNASTSRALRSAAARAAVLGFLNHLRRVLQGNGQNTQPIRQRRITTSEESQFESARGGGGRVMFSFTYLFLGTDITRHMTKRRQTFVFVGWARTVGWGGGWRPHPHHFLRDKKGRAARGGRRGDDVCLHKGGRRSGGRGEKVTEPMLPCSLPRVPSPAWR